MTSAEKIAFIKTIPEPIFWDLVGIPLHIERERLNGTSDRSASLCLNDVSTELRLFLHNPEIFFGKRGK